MANRTRYDHDFKSGAVELAIHSEKPVAQVAEELGIKHKGMDSTRPEELYQLGIRYFYGVEGIVPNPARAIKLLTHARDRGEHRAGLHLELAEWIKMDGV